MKATVTVHHPLSTDLGLLLIRLILGVVGVYHGGQKLFGLFGGQGISDFAKYLGSLDIPEPALNAYLVGSAEFFGGILVALGVLTRLAAVPYAFVMFAAVAVAHPSNFDVHNNGMEYALTLGVALVGIALTGAGRLSVDAMYSSSKSGDKEK